ARGWRPAGERRRLGTRLREARDRHRAAASSTRAAIAPGRAIDRTVAGARTPAAPERPGRGAAARTGRLPRPPRRAAPAGTAPRPGRAASEANRPGAPALRAGRAAGRDRPGQAVAARAGRSTRAG